MNYDEAPQVLPAWKSCLETMRETGIVYGSAWTIPWLEGQLRCGRDEMTFSVAVSNIREELEYDGFYLAIESEQDRYVILPPEDNRKVMARYLRAAKRETQRAVILGSNTDTTGLTDEQKKSLAHTLETAAVRLILIRRSATIAKALVESGNKKLLD